MTAGGATIDIYTGDFRSIGPVRAKQVRKKSPDIYFKKKIMVIFEIIVDFSSVSEVGQINGRKDLRRNMICIMFWVN